jgi:hypothetical protein
MQNVPLDFDPQRFFQSSFQSSDPLHDSGFEKTFEYNANTVSFGLSMQASYEDVKALSQKAPITR